MKKAIASLLCLVMLLGLITGCSQKPTTADADKPQNKAAETSSANESTKTEKKDETEPATEPKEILEKLDITISSNASFTGKNVGYENDPLYKYACDRFGVNVTEIYASGWSICREKETMWITSGTMPDSMFWSVYSLADYVSYVDQGFFQPLPDGWEDRWPNLAKMNKDSGISDLLTIDGKVYGIAHPLYGNFLDVGQDCIEIYGVFFRKDWAEQVGMADLGKDGKMTLSELKEYLKKVGEAGLCSRATMGGLYQQWIAVFTDAYGLPEFNGYLAPYVEDENGFVYTPTMDGYVECIQELQDWYSEGLIDKDIYNNSNIDYPSLLATGQLAAYVRSASPDKIETIRKNYVNAGGADKYDFGVAAISNDKGEFCKSQRTNLWGLTVFNPDTSMDKLERILNLSDWVASKEGATALWYGIPGENWELNDDGSIKKLNEDYTADFRDVFTMLGYCNEDFMFSGFNSTLDPVAVNESKAMFDFESSGKVYHTSLNYDSYSSPAKDDFSLKPYDKMIEIICDGSDVEASWNGWIEETSGLWKPLQEELNATYYK